MHDNNNGGLHFRGAAAAKCSTKNSTCTFLFAPTRGVPARLKVQGSKINILVLGVSVSVWIKTSLEMVVVSRVFETSNLFYKTIPLWMEG